MLGQCSFNCFNADDLKKVRAINRKVPLGYLSAKPPIPADLELVDQLKPAFLDYDYKSTTPADFGTCAAAGVEVSLWTINTREDARPFIAAGAAYVTTDTILEESGFVK